MTLHLVRAGATPLVLAEGDWVVYLDDLDDLILDSHGQPLLAPGPIHHDQLVQLVFAADRVITW
ncbi:MAG: hypothetical protein WKG01_32110 [Kofleriaceae bacterium]